MSNELDHVRALRAEDASVDVGSRDAARATLLTHIAATAEGRAVGGPGAPKGGRHRRRRVVLVGAAGLMVGLTAFGLARLPGGGGQATAAARVLERAARSAAGGLTAPRLHPGQWWYTSRVESLAESCQFGGSPSTGFASARAWTVSHHRVDIWVSYNASQRGRARMLGRPQFHGSAAERARLKATGRCPSVEIAPAFTTVGATHFGVGRQSLTYRELLHFPSTPEGVLRFVRADGTSHPDMFDALSGLLSEPLRAPSRAAVFQAIAMLPGVHYLGKERDPLGRPGVAIGFVQTTPTPVVGPPPVLRSTLDELIFDPQTAGLLAERTVLLSPLPIPGVGTGFALSWTAYVKSRVVAQSAVPTLRELGLGGRTARSR